MLTYSDILLFICPKLLGSTSLMEQYKYGVTLNISISFLVRCFLNNWIITVQKFNTQRWITKKSNFHKMAQVKILFALVVLISVCISLQGVEGGCLNNRGGCYYGYCWAGCTATSVGEWCYTTKTYSQSYDYVTCSSDSDCDLCWACAGPCSWGW